MISLFKKADSGPANPVKIYRFEGALHVNSACILLSDSTGETNNSILSVYGARGVREEENLR